MCIITYVWDWTTVTVIFVPFVSSLFLHSCITVEENKMVYYWFYVEICSRQLVGPPGERCVCASIIITNHHLVHCSYHSNHTSQLKQPATPDSYTIQPNQSNVYYPTRPVNKSSRSFQPLIPTNHASKPYQLTIPAKHASRAHQSFMWKSQTIQGNHTIKPAKLTRQFYVHLEQHQANHKIHLSSPYESTVPENIPPIIYLLYRTTIRANHTNQTMLSTYTRQPELLSFASTESVQTLWTTPVLWEANNSSATAGIYVQM